MNYLQAFQFGAAKVRTLVKNGEPWFVGRDVAETLGYANPQKAVRDHCRYAIPVGVNESFTLDPQTVIISEGDMYRLVIKSALPSAAEFEKWVMDEVLPAIRKTGSYDVKTPEMQIAHAMLLAGKMIEQQKVLIEEMTPKAEFYDAVTGSATAVDMAVVAKTLNMGIGRNQLFEFLRDKGILDRKNTPYQQYVDRGYFRIVESSYSKPDGSTHVSFKTVVFQRGLEYIRKLYTQDKA